MPVHLILTASMQGWWTRIIGEPYLFCEELPCKDLINIRLGTFFPICFIFNHSLLLHMLVQKSFQMLLNKVQGQRSDWEYPFAVAGINISFMLIQMLDLQSSNIPFMKPLCTKMEFSVHPGLYHVQFVQVFHPQSLEFDFLNCLGGMRTHLITCTVWPFGCLMLSGL